MIAAQLFGANLVKVLVVVTIVGILVQRRQRLCWSFLGYLVAILVGNSLSTFWPDQFHTVSFWMLKQAVYDIAKLAVALDLADSAFRSFPGARATARFVLLCILLVTGVAIIGVSVSALPSVVLGEWHPRIISGTIWLMTATAVLVVWYRLPVHAFQRAILLGFTCYLLVFTTLLNILRAHGLDLLDQLSLVDTFAYAGVMAWWAYATWRADEKLAVPLQVLQRLQLEHLA
ncbi:MAG TPA: hypothetical protein VKI41_16540 [Vicinamibacteria bacterium]|nr:hypothetical protein [Vicinamibacteria bacterium]